MVHVWLARSVRAVRIWLTSCALAVRVWLACGAHLAHLWCTSGPHTVRVWLAHGLLTWLLKFEPPNLQDFLAFILVSHGCKAYP